MVPDLPRFTIEDISAGPHAHGFGSTAEGHPYVFRVRGSILEVEVYRGDLESEVPVPEDILASARRSVREIDLTDERSITALVRDVVAELGARVGEYDGPGSSVRALLARVGSVIGGFLPESHR